MFRMTLTLVVALLAIQPPSPPPTTAVTDPKDLARVTAVSDALDALFERVGECTKAGRPTETCQCAYPQELTQLRNRHRALLTQHPAWKDQVLTYHHMKNGRNISGSLVMPTLARQLDVLKCQ
jgi:hypothetical protein